MNSRLTALAVLCVAAFTLSSSKNAWAQYGGSSSSDQQGFLVSSSLMFMTNSTKQGGSGPSGSTLLTDTSLGYNTHSFGIGGVFQYDKQGKSEVDTAYGPKLELYYSLFYLEAAWLLGVKRAFNDRSIADQTGKAWLFAFGVRVPVSESFFLQFAYKYRMEKITKQDGAALDQAITQNDGYPLFGLGLKF
jgi:hypothetical protein